MKTTKLGHGDFQPQDEPEVSIDYLRERMPELAQTILDGDDLNWANSQVCLEGCFNEAMIKFHLSDYWGETADGLKQAMDRVVNAEIERQIDASLVYEERLPKGWE